MPLRGRGEAAPLTYYCLHVICPLPATAQTPAPQGIVMATKPSHVLGKILEGVQEGDFHEWVEQEVQEMNDNSAQTEAGRTMYAGSYRIEITIINEDNEE